MGKKDTPPEFNEDKRAGRRKTQRDVEQIGKDMTNAEFLRARKRAQAKAKNVKDDDSRKKEK